MTQRLVVYFTLLWWYFLVLIKKNDLEHNQTDKTFLRFFTTKDGAIETLFVENPDQYSGDSA